MISVSKDTLLTHQYLRVTLKSVSGISGFILKAAHKNDVNSKGEPESK